MEEGEAKFLFSCLPLKRHDERERGRVVRETPRTATRNDWKKKGMDRLRGGTEHQEQEDSGLEETTVAATMALTGRIRKGATAKQSVYDLVGLPNRLR
ncbi:hypothetical protein BDV36DRAFT_278148 [Aspergillus pseudocaelatus]|uniref:Uncharacterized protein n=1 Tax=Aspergillus pseudocaelatus TaxID=1825620 RepID=A0ABQ6W2I8_9EURO|nr:hypothetical protein BDV36DRAFT_278148 [Aspergillus pseudocaelatus]